MKITERLRKLSDRNVSQVLNEPFVENNETDRLAAFLSPTKSKPETAEDMAFAGITLGDLLYDVSRVDPNVMVGADFARTEDLSDAFRFATFAERIVGKGTDALQGDVSQIQGYVAERLVAQHLQSQGMEVEFPEASNQEGWDLLVNDHPFQVKCLADASGVHEHLERFPDIPVFINSELAEKFDGVDGVYPVASVSHDTVTEATRQSLEDGAEVLDFEIPMIAVTIASARNAYAMVQGRTILIHAFQNIALDTAGRTVGGVAGSKALASAGLLLGPYGAVVGGLLGSVLGASQGKRLSSWVKANLLCAKEEDGVEQALRHLMAKAEKETRNKSAIIERKTDMLSCHLKDRGETKNHIWSNFEWRLDQESSYVKSKTDQFRRFGTAPRELDSNGGDILVAAAEGTLLTVQSGIPPHAIRQEFSVLSSSVDILKKAREKYLLK